MIVIIDNYDSFTYNLVQMIQQMGQETRVVRNDRVGLYDMEAMGPSALVVSPGPGTPADAGLSVAAVARFAPRIPVLGICLGHQAIAAAFGGEVVQSRRLMHGKTSPVYHDGRSVYNGIRNPFPATRYHSLIVRGEALPSCLEPCAWTEEGELMGLRHKQHAVEGMQFHPESILTDQGYNIVNNFVMKSKSQCK